MTELSNVGLSGRAIERGMLLLDPGYPAHGDRPRVWSVLDHRTRTLISHTGNTVERVTLKVPGLLPPGWEILDSEKLAARLLSDARTKDWLTIKPDTPRTASRVIR